MKIQTFILCLVSASSLIAVPAISNAASSGHPHHAALFVGATTAHSHTNFTLGADYEYRLDSLFGVGALYERILSPGTNIAAVSAYIHPAQDLKFNVSPGIEFGHGHSAFLARFGAAYDFHVDSYTVSPTFAFDVIEGGHTAIVYGLAFGFGF